MERYEILIAAALSWLLAQISKLVSALFKSKGSQSYFRTLFRQGGVVSSHSSSVASLALSCGLCCGFDSSEFAICFVLSAIVVLDAGGVRYTASRLSKYLNRSVPETEPEGGKFNENLGHTPLQIVLGLLLGVAVSALTHLIFNS